MPIPPRNTPTPLHVPSIVTVYLTPYPSCPASPAPSTIELFTSMAVGSTGALSDTQTILWEGGEDAGLEAGEIIEVAIGIEPCNLLELIVQHAYCNPYVIPILCHKFGEGPLFGQRYTVIEIEHIVAALYNEIPLLLAPPSPTNSYHSPHMSPHASPSLHNQSRCSLDTSSDYSVDCVEAEGQGQSSSLSSKPSSL